MINLEKINPASIILNAKKYKLYALSYLLQLTDDLTKEQQADLIWTLTRQLLIAESLFHEGTLIEENVIQEKFDQIQQNEVIKSLIESSIIDSSVLKEILEMETLYQKWCIDVQKDLYSQYEDNQEQLESFYNESPSFTQNSVYEIYKIDSLNQKPEQLTFHSLEDLKKIFNTDTKIYKVGIMPKETITSKLHIPEQFIQLYQLVPYKGSYYYISQYFEEYKAPFEDIKEDLLEFIIKEELENYIEEYAQNLLENINIDYHEDTIKKLI